MCVCMYLCMYVCVYIYTYIYICIYIYIYTYIHIHVYIYIYIKYSSLITSIFFGGVGNTGNIRKLQQPFPQKDYCTPYCSNKCFAQLYFSMKANGTLCNGVPCAQDCTMSLDLPMKSSSRLVLPFLGFKYIALAPRCHR